jgi:hypothetical protein
MMVFYAEEFNGSLDEFVSVQIDDAEKSQLKVGKVENTSWMGEGEAKYIEIVSSDGTRKAIHWFAVRHGKAYSFGCVVPKPTSDTIIGLCQDTAFSAKWN